MRVRRARVGGIARLFVTVSQAFLPNPARPPFYCDFFMEPVDGEPRLHLENTRKLKMGFLLDETLDEAATNLRSMRAIAFDWDVSTPRRRTYSPIVRSAASSRISASRMKQRSIAAGQGTGRGPTTAASMRGYCRS